MKIQHPDFPDLVRDVVNGESWLASGWAVFEDPAPEPEIVPCPLCGAVGDESCVTPSGAETSRHFARTQ